MHTTSEWWQAIKADPDKMNRWLVAQYHGERGASRRIREFMDKHAVVYSREYEILNVIADQEELHAEWVLALLKARGLDPSADHEERYWKHVLPEATDLRTGAAVGAHAEAMRLERIRLIANDDTAPEDVRAVFRQILPHEQFHERAFRHMAGSEHMSQLARAHGKAMEAIGLVL